MPFSFLFGKKDKKDKENKKGKRRAATPEPRDLHNSWPQGSLQHAPQQDRGRTQRRGSDELLAQGMAVDSLMEEYSKTAGYSDERPPTPPTQREKPTKPWEEGRRAELEQSRHLQAQRTAAQRLAQAR